jgi:hypothetical protein
VELTVATGRGFEALRRRCRQHRCRTQLEGRRAGPFRLMAWAERAVLVASNAGCWRRWVSPCAGGRCCGYRTGRPVHVRRSGWSGQFAVLTVLTLLTVLGLVAVLASLGDLVRVRLRGAVGVFAGFGPRGGMRCLACVGLYGRFGAVRTGFGLRAQRVGCAGLVLFALLVAGSCGELGGRWRRPVRLVARSSTSRTARPPRGACSRSPWRRGRSPAAPTRWPVRPSRPGCCAPLLVQQFFLRPLRSVTTGSHTARPARSVCAQLAVLWPSVCV